MYGAGDGRREEGTSQGGLKWPLLAALWYGEKSPARWCRIVMISSLTLWWPRYKMGLTGNKLAEGAMCKETWCRAWRGEEPIRRVEQQLSPVDFPWNHAVRLQARQGEGRTLADLGGCLQKAWERCKTSSSRVVGPQNDFSTIPEREQQHLPSSLGWGAPSWVQHL